VRIERGRIENSISIVNIFYLFFFVKQKQIENFADIIKKSWIFKIFKILKNQVLLEANFENWIIRKLSLGSSEVPQKFGLDRFSRFDFY